MRDNVFRRQDSIPDATHLKLSHISSAAAFHFQTPATLALVSNNKIRATIPTFPRRIEKKADLPTFTTASPVLTQPQAESLPLSHRRIPLSNASTPASLVFARFHFDKVRILLESKKYEANSKRSNHHSASLKETLWLHSAY